jgi:hypothetical protein
MSDENTWADGSPKVDTAPAAPELEDERAAVVTPAPFRVELARKFDAWIERNPMAAVELLELWQEASEAGAPELAELGLYLGDQIERLKHARNEVATLEQDGR